MNSDSISLHHFNDNGFVMFPGFIAGDDLLELRCQVDRFIENVVPKLPPEQVFYESKGDALSLKQIQHMELHDSWFGELFNAGPFRQTAENLLSGPVVPKNMQYFNKPPGSSQPTPPHQDGFYFMLDPCEAVTMWLALDDVDEENGCVRYVGGSHKRGMRGHARTTTLGFSQGISDYPSDEDRKHEVAIPARPGDLLVHHAMTIHRADANQSPNRSRRALGFIYFSERAKQDQEAQTAYQTSLAAELKAAGKL